ncbi:MAG: sporulation protein [Acidimicrobiia bacterium]
MTDTRDGVVGSILARIRDTVTSVTVYSDPIERNGVTVVPASVTYAGGGGGGGEDGKSGSGEGGGFGMVSRPVGAFVIRGDQVTWKPAIPPGLVLVALVVAARLLRKGMWALS